jgi:hypothetical protein
MYSTSLQILSIMITLAFIIFPSITAQSPDWLRKYLPGVYRPSHWNNIDHPEMDFEKKPHRLINPSQIISRMMSNIVLLLSFGLCSPVLCCYIALSICLHLSSWLLILGRFFCLRIDFLAASQYSFSGFLLSFSHSSSLEADHKTSDDQLLLLLDRQLHGVNSSLIVCKWPVILTSCFFVTLLSWDMAGDQGGWFEALWVPITGVVMVMAIWVWDRVLISDRIPDMVWSRHFSFLSLELVHSSLHHSSPALDEQERVPNQFIL